MEERQRFTILENICNHFEAIGFHAKVYFPKVVVEDPLTGFPKEVDDASQRLIYVETPGRETFVETLVTVDFLRLADQKAAANVLLKNIGEAIGKLFTEADGKIPKLKRVEVTNGRTGGDL